MLSLPCGCWPDMMDVFHI